MCEGYSKKGTIGFYIDYIKDFSNVNWSVWDDDKDKRVAGKLLEGNGHHFQLSNEEILLWYMPMFFKTHPHSIRSTCEILFTW